MIALCFDALGLPPDGEDSGSGSGYESGSGECVLNV